MSPVSTDRSSSMTRCVTLSVFLKMTCWPAATDAGFGEKDCFPLTPMTLMVTVVAVGVGVAPVGVELPYPPPPPPQLQAPTTPNVTTVNAVMLRMDLLQRETALRTQSPPRPLLVETFPNLVRTQIQWLRAAKLLTKPNATATFDPTAVLTAAIAPYRMR